MSIEWRTDVHKCPDETWVLTIADNDFTKMCLNISKLKGCEYKWSRFWKNWDEITHWARLPNIPENTNVTKF